MEEETTIVMANAASGGGLSCGSITGGRLSSRGGSSSTGGRGDSAAWQKMRLKQQRLLLLHHASRCQHDAGQCPVTPHCASMKRLWEHMAHCKDDLSCQVEHCVSSRYMLSHYRRCKDPACPACGPIREAIRSNSSNSFIDHSPALNNDVIFVPSSSTSSMTPSSASSTVYERESCRRAVKAEQPSIIPSNTEKITVPITMMPAVVPAPSASQPTTNASGETPTPMNADDKVGSSKQANSMNCQCLRIRRNSHFYKMGCNNNSYIRIIAALIVFFVILLAHIPPRGVAAAAPSSSDSNHHLYTNTQTIATAAADSTRSTTSISISTNKERHRRVPPPPWMLSRIFPSLFAPRVKKDNRNHVDIKGEEKQTESTTSRQQTKSVDNNENNNNEWSSLLKEDVEKKIANDGQDDDDTEEEAEEEATSRTIVSDDDDHAVSLSTEVAAASQQEERRPTRKIRPWSVLGSLMASAVKGDPKRLARSAATCCQVGLVAYLGYTIWKTIVEVAEEFNNSANNNIDAMNDPQQLPYVQRPQHVSQLVEFLEQDAEDIVEAIQQHQRQQQRGKKNNNKSSAALMTVPQISLLQLAQKLLAAGLPLRSPTTTATAATIGTSDDSDSATVPASLPSVESVLLELTRGEASLLLQCLWSPPRTATTDHRHGHSGNLWNHVAGLRSVKERLQVTLSSLQHAIHNNNNKNRSGSHAAMKAKQYQEYASLFSHTPTTGTTAFSSSKHHHNLNHPPAMTGVLLYGPPGCGKTLLVKALASSSRLPCLVVTPSVLLRKYVGDTNLQVRSLFTLASKLAPCIVCIDELDGLFRERNDLEHEATRDLKTEFLQWWDGMMSSSSSSSSKHFPILVVGATNRPFDVDSAVLRRLPQSHYIGLPDASARLEFLISSLRSCPTEDNIDLPEIVRQTEHYSPSDLRQVLQTAAVTGPLRRSGEGAVLSTQDILQALQVTPSTPLNEHYQMQLLRFARHQASLPQSSLVGRQSSSSSPKALDFWPDGTGDKWETPYGNFYNLGELEIDSETFDTLSEIISQMEDDESTDDLDDDDSEDDRL